MKEPRVCPNCDFVGEVTIYDIGDGPEWACPDCEMCYPMGPLTVTDPKTGKIDMEKVEDAIDSKVETRPLPDEYGGEILRTEVGSTLHGTGLPGGEDHDEMGIFVEWPRTTIGLDRVEQYEWRTAPRGERSGPGDTDLVVYSLRKWAGLALKGNPSVLLPLFAPDEKVIDLSYLGDRLRDNAQWFASRRAGSRFLGYMNQQRARMMGTRGTVGRVRKMPDGEVDWKYLMHILRLGHQGVEFVQTGRITLPVPGEVGDRLRAVRRGDVPFDEAMNEAEWLETMLREVMETSELPDEPNREAVQEFVIKAHLEMWEMEFA